MAAQATVLLLSAHLEVIFCGLAPRMGGKHEGSWDKGGEGIIPGWSSCGGLGCDAPRPGHTHFSGVEALESEY